MDKRIDYNIYGIHVFDPKKTYIMPVVFSEDKQPWYKRLWQYIKNIIKIWHK